MSAPVVQTAAPELDAFKLRSPLGPAPPFGKDTPVCVVQYEDWVYIGLDSGWVCAYMIEPRRPNRKEEERKWGEGPKKQVGRKGIRRMAIIDPQSSFQQSRKRASFRPGAPRTPVKPGRTQDMTAIAAILRQKTGPTFTVSSNTSLADIASLLSSNRIGAVPVLEADYLAGIVSERDIVRCLASNGAAALDLTAADAMTRSVQTTTPDTTVQDAMTAMTAGRFRHLQCLKAARWSASSASATW